jgi:hypothetical protein
MGECKIKNNEWVRGYARGAGVKPSPRETKDTFTVSAVKMTQREPVTHSF